MSRRSSASRFASTDEGEYVVLDHQNMLSEERLRTEKSLKNIFQRIALFRYDDARSAVNQAFDSTSKQSGNSAFGSSVLGQLRPVIVNLIDKERDYVQSDLRKNKSQLIKNIASFSHNITSGRNYIPNTVDRLKSDLRAIASRDVGMTSRDVSMTSQNDVTALVRTVAAELDIYVNARFTMLHDQIITEFCKDAETAVKTSFCRDSLKSLHTVREMTDTIKSDALSPMKNMLEYETNVVEQLFSCSLALAQWDFVGSLLHLHNYNQTYKEFIEGYKGKERSLMGKKIIKDDEFPELYKWFFKLYELLLSKYTLYFSKTLFQDSSRKVMRSSTTNIVDHRTKLNDFSKKSKAATISLILNAANLERPFMGHGCKLFSEQAHREIASKHSFIDKFEVIFHYGNGKDETLDEETKTEIVHLYSDVYHKNGKPYIYDTKRNRSYYLLLFDENVFLSVSYNTKKSERDSEIIKFLEDFKNSMSLSKV
ncbi:KICSTOR subunit 2-like isoform X2 [Bolinopsis microptera]|uniref:KICSTOR subunit 2-like isoform X2 n=1 Tax=Bolinopsis microptera TaxID=2820187 RepID=UPI00307AF650